MGANQSWWTDGTTAAQPRTRGPRGTRPPLLTDGADPQSRGALSPGGVPTPGHRREGPRVSCAPQFRHALQALPPRTRDNPQPPGHPPKCPHAQQTRSLGRDSAANPPTPAPSTRVLSLTRVDTWDLHKTTLPDKRAAQGHTSRTRKLALTAPRQGALLWVPGPSPTHSGPHPGLCQHRPPLCSCPMLCREPSAFLEGDGGGWR